MSSLLSQASAQIPIETHAVSYHRTGNRCKEKVPPTLVHRALGFDDDVWWSREVQPPMHAWRADTLVRLDKTQTAGVAGSYDLARRLNGVGHV
jgi:hypothetical protein